MSCQKIREWLENSSFASLHEMPAELARHLNKCPGCSVLIRRLVAQCVVPLPENLLAGIPDMKKRVLSQPGMQTGRSAEKTGILAWPAFWKLALIPVLAIVALVVAYFMTGQATRGTDRNAISGTVIATIVRAHSLVEKQCTGTAGYVAALTGDRLCGGDAVRTGEDSSAELVFPDNSKVMLGSGAWFKLIDTGRIGEHLRGRALFEIEKQTSPGSIEILTPQGVTAVLGTKFVQEVGETACFIAVSEGVVEFRPNNQERHVLRPGNLLCFDNTGKVTAHKELDSAVISKLYDLNKNVALAEVVSSDNSSSDAVPEIKPVVEPVRVPDSITTSTRQIDKSGDETRLPSDSVQTAPVVAPAEIASAARVPDDEAPGVADETVNEEPGQSEESGQSTLGVSGL